MTAVNTQTEGSKMLTRLPPGPLIPGGWAHGKSKSYSPLGCRPYSCFSGAWPTRGSVKAALRQRKGLMKVFSNPQSPCPDILIPQEVLYTFPHPSGTFY